MKRSSSLVTITLKNLESSDAFSAQLWRWFRDHPRTTTKEAAAGLGIGNCQVQARVADFVRLGWLARVPSQTRAHRFVALDSGEERRRGTPSSDLQPIRARLTAIARRAEAARRTGLAVQMGQALSEIEKEAREIRESLIARKER